MIYTVFPKSENSTDLLQDFSSYEEAKEYAETELDCAYEIESTGGDVL